MRAAAKKRAYHHGDLRRALVDEALLLVAEQGIARLTLRETARRVGVSEAAPYRHFPSKAALVAAAAEEGFRTLLVRVGEALRRAPAHPGSRLAALAAAYVRFAADDPARFRVMFGREVAGSHGFAGLWAAAQENFAVLLNEIAAGQRAGLLRGRDPRGAALAAWSAFHGLAFLLVEGLLARQGLAPSRGLGVEALARQVAAALLEGLLLRPRPQGRKRATMSSSRR